LIFLALKHFFETHGRSNATTDGAYVRQSRGQYQVGTSANQPIQKTKENIAEMIASYVITNVPCKKTLKNKGILRLKPVQGGGEVHPWN
jgi:hypothetical protein